MFSVREKMWMWWRNRKCTHMWVRSSGGEEVRIGPLHVLKWVCAKCRAHTWTDAI